MPPLQVESVTETADMLALLREAPRRRVVSYLVLPDGFEGPCVCEFPGDALQGNARVVAIIGEGGTARPVLDQAYEADLAKDGPAWEALPLRYGPHCSMWVLPDHPETPTVPGMP